MKIINTFLEALSIFISQLGGFGITLICLGILFFIVNSILDIKSKNKKSTIDGGSDLNTNVNQSGIVDTDPNDYSKNIVSDDFTVDDWAKDVPNNATAKGRFLEYLVINNILHNYPNSRILRNLIIPKPKGGTSEIDILVLNPKGIVCIECKNYSAKISGSYKDKYWRAEYNESHIVDFYSPVLQNLNHVKTLNYLNLGFKIHNIVVFCDNADLSDEVFKNKNIVKLKYINRKLDYIFSTSDCMISDDELDGLYNRILKSQTVNVLDHLSYVESVNTGKLNTCAN